MILNILALVICVYSAAVIIIMIRLARQKIINSVSGDITPSDALRMFRNNEKFSPEEIACAAAVLVNVSYFSVHIQTNKGENYEDHVQKKSYTESLTPSNLRYINSLS